MKCSKVKNPCKICFQSVNKKNGLQCQGACKKWAHYKCLNYTPGKIHDLKAGIIEITCPCPDCNTSSPKEKKVNPPFTCNNTKCPANKLPICPSKECPSNQNPIPTYPPPPFQCSPDTSPARTPPLTKCAVNKTSSPPQIQQKCKQPTKSNPHTSKLNPKLNCSSPATPPTYKAQKFAKPCPPCPSQQLINMQKNKVCTAKQSQSCSNLSNKSSCSDNQQLDNLRVISSASQVQNMDPKTLYAAIENLCNTVGELSHQIKHLMCKINRGQV